MKITLAHDYFTQRGGAERVALLMADIFEPDNIVTSFLNYETTFDEVRHLDLTYSRFSKIRALKHDPRLGLLILPFIWSLFRPASSEILLCSSSGWSHGLRKGKSTKKIVYCHNPPRWLYQPNEYNDGLSAFAKFALKLFSPVLKIWDRKSARSADLYIANSSSVAHRIKNFYGIEPIIIFPPVDVSADKSLKAVSGLSDFFLTVSRARGYKGTKLLEEAFLNMPDKKLVVVGGEKRSSNIKNIIYLGRVDDSTLCWLYSNANALISVSREDFGLTPIEANSFGTPSLLLKRGGFLDSTAPGISGMFIEDDTVESIIEGVRQFPKNWNRNDIKDHAKKFSVENFKIKMQEIMMTTLHS